MSYSRFRFAKIKNHKVDDNFLERLGEGMLKFGVQNIEPRRFGFRVVKKEKDHLWARFVKERIRKDPVLTRTNDESKESHRVAHFKYVFIFPNGLIAYETLRITKSDIFEAIVASWQKVKKSNESDIEIITKHYVPWLIVLPLYGDNQPGRKQNHNRKRRYHDRQKYLYIRKTLHAVYGLYSIQPWGQIRSKNETRRTPLDPFSLFQPR